MLRKDGKSFNDSSAINEEDLTDENTPYRFLKVPHKFDTQHTARCRLLNRHQRTNFPDPNRGHHQAIDNKVKQVQGKHWSNVRQG